MAFDEFALRKPHQAALIGRLFYSSMFLLFGYGKITAFAGTVSYMSSLGVPAPSLFALLAIIIEIVGGLLILIGYQTRIVALGLAVYVLISALYRALAMGRPESIPTLHEKHGDRRRFASVCRFRRWRLFARRQKAATLKLVRMP